MKNGQFTIEPFKPPRGLRNEHIQSLWARWKQRSDNLSFRRQRLELSDGDFIDLDFADVHGFSWAELGDNAPIVLLLPGISGSGRASYLRYICEIMATAGFRPVTMNYRGCSGEPNRLARLYHAGATEDVQAVHQSLMAEFPDTNIGMLGVSLGATMLLNYLGKHNTANPKTVQACVSISPFFDLKSSVILLETGIRQMYGNYILSGLMKKVETKRNLLVSLVDVDYVLASKTLFEFDERGTAPVHGFDSAQHFYDYVSPTRQIRNIQANTLLIRALDDPFFARPGIPISQLLANQNISTNLPEFGGHVGFVERYSGQSWAIRQAVRFLSLGLFD